MALLIGRPYHRKKNKEKSGELTQQAKNEKIVQQIRYLKD